MRIYKKIAGIIILSAASVFLFWLFVVIPFMILREAIRTIIGRPFGSGWMRVDAEICTMDVPQEIREQMIRATELPQEIQAQMNRKLPASIRYAVYEIDGMEHRVPVNSFKGRQHCRLYVRQDAPDTIWDPKFENRTAAVIGALIILLFWAGLVWSGICIYKMIRS